MKKYSLHICLLVMAVPMLVLAQTGTVDKTKSFYTELAKRDALNEQQLTLVTADDHKDFWKDQNDFETLLAKQNPEGYNVYLRVKGNAYRLHQKICAAECNHTEHYLNKAAFYAVNGEGQFDIALSAETKKPQEKD